MDIENLIKEATGLPVADMGFARPQKLPFIIFADKQKTDGDDFNVRIVTHDLVIELYTEKCDSTNIKKLEDLLKKMNWNWTHSRDYMPKPEDCFVETYEIRFCEKYRKEA